MDSRLIKNKVYYFLNKKVIVIDCGNLLNLAVVRYVDSIKEFVVDVNFIQSKPSHEKFISINDLARR